MASERQKAANRANALRSTGPRTLEGKAAVSLNAIRHGFLAHGVVLTEEDADAFEDLRNRVRAHLSPVGPIEEFLVERMVSHMWRLHRLIRAETALIHSRVQGLKADRLKIEARSYVETVETLMGFDTLPFHRQSRAYGSARSARPRDLPARPGRGSARPCVRCRCQGG